MAKSRCSLPRAATCLAALLCLASVSFAQINRASLYGRVQTEIGAAVGGAVSAALRNDELGFFEKTSVDSDGNFQFTAVPHAVYTLKVEADGFEPYQQSVDLSSPLIPKLNIQVVVTPVTKRQVSAATAPSLTDQAAPKTARKEFEKARRAWQAHKVEEEQRHLERALKAYPCYARALTVEADLELTQKQYRRAETSYKQAIHCDAGYFGAVHGLAALYIKEHKPAQSESVLLQAQRLMPQDWLARYELGEVHFSMGEYAKAADDFSDAESFHPDMPAEFHIQLANAYLKAGAYAKALRQIHAYLSLSPKGRYAATAREMADKLRREGVTEVPGQIMPPSAPKP